MEDGTALRARDDGFEPRRAPRDPHARPAAEGWRVLAVHLVDLFEIRNRDRARGHGALRRNLRERGGDALAIVSLTLLKSLDRCPVPSRCRFDRFADNAPRGEELRVVAVRGIATTFVLADLGKLDEL